MSERPEDWLPADDPGFWSDPDAEEPGPEEELEDWLLEQIADPPGTPAPDRSVPGARTGASAHHRGE